MLTLRASDVFSAALKLRFYSMTLFLFTKSDIKTIVAPVSVFALATTPSASLWRIPHIMFWLWLHLLQLCVSNQAVAPQEDALNKPWRPIPSGRITVGSARLLRWGLLPTCFLISHAYNVLGISVTFIVLAWAYNEGGMHAAWHGKQLCNACGYASLELGATTIAAGGSRLDSAAFIAVAASGLVILTTGWAQDFPDQDGDRLQGNITIPLAAPRVARAFLPPAILAWSFALTVIWELGIPISIALLALGCIVGSRFWIFRTTEQDEASFFLYNVWLTVVHLLPMVHRYFLVARIPHLHKSLAVA